MNICKKKPGCDLSITRRLNGRFDISLNCFSVRPDNVIELNGYPMGAPKSYGNISWGQTRTILLILSENYPRVAIPKFVHQYFDYQTKFKRVLLVVRSFFH